MKKNRFTAANIVKKNIQDNFNTKKLRPAYNQPDGAFY